MCPMSQYTLGGQVPVLCLRTGMLLGLSPGWALAPHTPVGWAFFFSSQGFDICVLVFLLFLGYFQPPARCLAEQSLQIPAFIVSPPFSPSECRKVFYRGNKTYVPWKLQSHRLTWEQWSIYISLHSVFAANRPKSVDMRMLLLYYLSQKQH